LLQYYTISFSTYFLITTGALFYHKPFYYRAARWAHLAVL
jgi:hypothetical protein